MGSMTFQQFFSYKQPIKTKSTDQLNQKGYLKHDLQQVMGFRASYQSYHNAVQ